MNGRDYPCHSVTTITSGCVLSRDYFKFVIRRRKQKALLRMIQLAPYLPVLYALNSAQCSDTRAQFVFTDTLMINLIWFV